MLIRHITIIILAAILFEISWNDYVPIAEKAMKRIRIVS